MALIEILVELLCELAHLTLRVLRLAVAPLKFLVSSRYRASVRNSWRTEGKGEGTFEVVCGTLVLVVLGVLLAYWGYVALSWGRGAA